jgi:putative membrane protein
LSTLIIIAVAGLLGGLVIWVVAKFNLGLEVDSFATAFATAILIALIAAVAHQLLGALGITIAGGWLGAIMNLIISGLVLMVAGRTLPGLKVAGFVGALIAAIGIGIVTWIVAWVLALFA